MELACVSARAGMWRVPHARARPNPTQRTQTARTRTFNCWRSLFGLFFEVMGRFLKASCRFFFSVGSALLNENSITPCDNRPRSVYRKRKLLAYGTDPKEKHLHRERIHSLIHTGLNMEAYHISFHDTVEVFPQL